MRWLCVIDAVIVHGLFARCALIVRVFARFGYTRIYAYIVDVLCVGLCVCCAWIARQLYVHLFVHCMYICAFTVHALCVDCMRVGGEWFVRWLCVYRTWVV